MRFALVNPNWTFEGSIYFGCREPHLPIEFGYSKQILESVGSETLLVDALSEHLSNTQIEARLASFKPDVTVVTTAPSYLFWRCPPPELKVPRELVLSVRHACGTLVLVGPHPSTTPGAALRKTGADLAIRGEFETVLPLLADYTRSAWKDIPAISFLLKGKLRAGTPHACRLEELPALKWPSDIIEHHRHHHHRFDIPYKGPGAEVEASRGCPFGCTFCAKENFRNKYRKRPLGKILDELEALRKQGVEYVYFIDEIFMPDPELLSRLAPLGLKFGMQTRIDLWDHRTLDLAGRAGCVSIEAGVESITAEGRAKLGKHSKLSMTEMAELLIFAKSHVAFVQANMIVSETDDPAQIERWRADLHAHGVWANKPVPLFPYPGSPIYRSKWGEPDDHAWERAHRYYLDSYSGFSDIQEQMPLSLRTLEAGS